MAGSQLPLDTKCARLLKLRQFTVTMNCWGVGWVLHPDDCLTMPKRCSTGSWLTLLVIKYLKPLVSFKYFYIDKVLDSVTRSPVAVDWVRKPRFPSVCLSHSDKKDRKLFNSTTDGELGRSASAGKRDVMICTTSWIVSKQCTVAVMSPHSCSILVLCSRSPWMKVGTLTKLAFFRSYWGFYGWR